MSIYIRPPALPEGADQRVADWLDDRVAELCDRQAEHAASIQEWVQDQQEAGEYPDLLHDLIIAQAPVFRGRVIEGWLAGASTRRIWDAVIEKWARWHAEHELSHRFHGQVPAPEVEP